MSFRSQRLLRSAEGQACVECGTVGTTVSAHVNSVALGSGTGIKAPDCLTMHLCQQCHDLYDGRRPGLNKEEKQDMWNRCFVRTILRLFDQGFVVVK